MKRRMSLKPQPRDIGFQKKHMRACPEADTPFLMSISGQREGPTGFLDPQAFEFRSHATGDYL